MLARDEDMPIDETLYFLILRSTLDTQNCANIGKIKEDSEMEEIFQCIGSTSNNQQVLLQASYEKFKNSDNNETTIIDANQIDLNDCEKVALLPNEIFCRIIYERNNYLLNHPLPNKVRIKEIEKFRVQLKALRDKLLNMMPVNIKSPKMSKTTMVVVHYDISASKSTKDLENNSQTAVHQTSDMVNSVQSMSSEKRISASCTKTALKHQCLVGQCARNFEMPSSKETKDIKSEHNQKKDIFKNKKTCGVDVKDKFRFALKECRVLLKRLKEIQNVPKAKKRKQLLPFRRRSERINMKNYESKNKSISQSSKLDQLCVEIGPINKEKEDNISDGRKLKIPEHILPAKAGNENKIWEKQNQKINDTLVPAVEQKIVHHKKNQDKIIDVLPIEKKKDAKLTPEKLVTFLPMKDRKVENEKDILQALIKNQENCAGLLIEKREEIDHITDNTQKIKETFSPIGCGKKVNITTKNNQRKRNKLLSNGKLKKMDLIDEKVLQKREALLKEKNENSISEEENLKKNKGLSVDENKKIEIVRDKTPEKRESISLIEDGRESSFLRVEEREEADIIDKKQVEECFKAPSLSQSVLQKSEQKEVKFKETSNAKAEMTEVNLLNTNEVTTNSLLKEMTPTPMWCSKISDKLSKNKNEKEKLKNSSEKQRNTTAKQSGNKESTTKPLKKNEAIKQLYEEYVKKAQNRKSTLLKLEKASSKYQPANSANKYGISESFKNPMNIAIKEQNITNKCIKSNEEKSDRKKYNEEMLSLINPKKIQKPLIDTESKLFERPYKIPRLKASSSSQKILSKCPEVLKSNDIDLTAIPSLFHNPFKNNNELQRSEEFYSYHDYNVLRLSKLKNSMDDENSAKKGCLKDPHQKIIEKSTCSPSTTSNKSIPFESNVHTISAHSAFGLTTNANHEDFIEFDCSDISSIGSWDISQVDSCNKKKSKFSSGFSNGSNIELTQDDLFDWDKEFMSMNSKPQKNQILSPIKRIVQKIDFTSTPKKSREPQSISKTKIVQNEVSQRQFTCSYSYKDRCMNYLPWVLKMIDMPLYEVNKPNRLGELLSSNQYKDRRLLRHKNLIRLSSIKSFHHTQNEKNRILLFRALQNSQWYSDKYVAKMLLCDLIRFLGDYHVKCEQQGCSEKFDLKSIESATQIDRLLNMLNLYVTECGEVMQNNSISSIRTDINSLNRDHSIHENQQSQVHVPTFSHYCENNNKSPFKDHQVSHGNQQPQVFQQTFPQYRENNYKNRFKGDFTSHRNQYSEVCGPMFPHYRENNNKIRFNEDHTSHGNQQPEVFSSTFSHCFEKNARRRRYWPAKHFEVTRPFFQKQEWINLPRNHLNEEEKY